MSVAAYKPTTINIIINILFMLMFVGMVSIVFFTIQGDLGMITISAIATNTITGMLLSAVTKLNARLCKENYNLMKTISELIKRKY